MSLDQRLRSASAEVREMTSGMDDLAPTRSTLLARLRVLTSAAVAALAIVIVVVTTVVLVPRGDDFVETTSTTEPATTTTTVTAVAQPAVTVPSLAGEPSEEAIGLLESLGLTVAGDASPDEDVPEGLVIRTKPPAGTEVDAGSVVEVIVSTGPRSATATTVPATLQPPTFPDQVSVPVTLFIGGTVYDLSQVPPRQIVTVAEPAVPYEANPVTTSHGVVLAVGSGYDAALTLFPPQSEPIIIAEHVSSFVVSPDETRIAWTEPWPEDVPDVYSPTRVVEASFPAGEILQESIFTGFDLEGLPTFGFGSVQGYVEDNVLMMTGDGAVATAAVWVPAEDRFVRAAGYNTHAYTNTSGNRVVLSQGDGQCGIVATLDASGRVDPPDGGEVRFSIDCWASQSATFSPNGSRIATAGTDGEAGGPILLLSNADGTEIGRLPIEGIPGRYASFLAIKWLDDDRLLLLVESWDDRSASNPHGGYWDLIECVDGPRTCRHLQSIEFSPTGFKQVTLVGRP